MDNTQYELLGAFTFLLTLLFRLQGLGILSAYRKIQITYEVKKLQGSFNMHVLFT